MFLLEKLEKRATHGCAYIPAALEKQPWYPYSVEGCRTRVTFTPSAVHADITP